MCVVEACRYSVLIRVPTGLKYRSLSHPQCREPRHLDSCLSFAYHQNKKKQVCWPADRLVKRGESRGWSKVGRVSADLDDLQGR